MKKKTVKRVRYEIYKIKFKKNRKHYSLLVIYTQIFIHYVNKKKITFKKIIIEK